MANLSHIHGFASEERKAQHTPTPWMTQPCGEMLPNDVMIVADCGKNSDGIQAISTVARALSIRQTKEVTAANAAFIVEAVNNHTPMLKSLESCAKLFDILAAKLDRWAVESQTGGWSTHQVDENLKTANDCRRYASQIRSALPHGDVGSASHE